MKKLFAFGLIACLMMVVAPFAGTAGAGEYSTQGNFAEELAKCFKKTFASVSDATVVLSELKVEPSGGWKAGEELTNALLQDIAKDVAAVPNGTLALSCALANLTIPEGWETAANETANRAALASAGTGAAGDLPPAQQKKSTASPSVP